MRSGLDLPARCLVVLFVSVCLGGAAAAAHASIEQPSVLILLPGQPGLPAATAIASAIRAEFLTEWSFRASIEVEHVDVARFASPDVEERRLRAVYGSKYGTQRFDVIVAALPEPFRFILRARDELWPGTPVVVCGVDERSVRDVKLPPGFAVLTIRFDMEGTVRVALALLPETRHVALVGGASPPEQVYHELVRQAVSRVGRLDLIDLTRLPIADALARVSRLPEHTVIVQSSYQVDGAGRRFHGIDLVPHVSNAANRPVFTPLGLALGRGVVGGSIIEFEDIGRDAARMATRLLRGDDAPPIPVPSLATSAPRFDGRQLARWNLDERRLPADSEVVFPVRSLWQEYRWYVVTVGALSVAQAALIVTLLLQRRHRRKAEAVLAERLRFDAVVSEVVTACTTATREQLDGRIRDCLRRVAMFVGVDRGVLWSRPPGSSVLWVTQFWQREGADGPPPMLLDLGSFPYFRERAEAGEMVCFTSPDDLPPGAPAERAAFSAAGVRSFAAIPLAGGGRQLGFLFFLSLHAERPWPLHVVEQLRTLAEPFSTALIRMQSAAVVESSVAMTDAVLAALPGETAIIDSAGTIVQTNEAWAAARGAVGAEPALKVGTNYLAACWNAIDMPFDVARKVHASIESVLRGERDDFALEYPTSRGGDDRWFEVRVRRLARFGEGAAVMHFDVTARRQAEAAAHRHLSHIAHLDRVAGMGQLSASLAHELNQPLTGILANAQAARRLLASSPPDLDELRACLADIVSDDCRASEVIRRMRGLLTKTDVVSVPLPLNHLAASTIGLVANEALLHSVTIQFSPASGLPMVYGDVVQIQQVILNLLTNAITAAADGGTPTRKVTVETSVVTAAHVELSVHDSGKGITEANLGRIFEPFFTTKVDGFGMGLAISRTIVEAHGGRLLVENDPAGGATFRVHLRTDPSRRDESHAASADSR